MEREVDKYEKRDGSIGNYSMYLKYKKDTDSDYDRRHKSGLNKAISDYRQRKIVNTINKNSSKIHPIIQLGKGLKMDELERNQR